MELTTNQSRQDTRICSTILADLDPDVDAIYRRANSLNVGYIRFSRAQTSIALESFTFSPYDTQNTITHYEAFWVLFLPIRFRWTNWQREMQCTKLLKRHEGRTRDLSRN